MSPNAPMPLPACRSDCLSAVVDHADAVLSAYRVELVYPGALAVKMNRQYSLGLARYLLLGFRRVKVEIRGIDVREDRGGADDLDSLRGSHKSERGGDDLIARADIACGKRNDQRVRAGVHGYPVFGFAEAGDFLFERGHIGAADESSRFEDIAHRLGHFILKRQDS